MLNRMFEFSELSEQDTSQLCQHSTTRVYPANTILISEGDQSDSLYVILDGQVKVYVSDNLGKEVILNIMDPGEFFGELALLDNEPRSASVKTLTQAKIMIISKQDFKNSLSSNSKMIYKLINFLIRQIRTLTSNVKKPGTIRCIWQGS